MCKNTDIPRWDIQSPNWPELYTVLLHQVSFRCRRMQTYPCHIYTHTNWSQCYRALLYHVSFTYGRMEMYPCQMCTTLLIEPTTTEFYHTMSLWYVAECRCTHMRPFCHSTHVNWLKCFHVTTLNNCWSHSVLSWWFIRNYLMNHFHLYEQRAYVSIFWSQHLMHVMNCDVVWNVHGGFSLCQLTKFLCIYVLLNMWCT